MRRSIPGQSKSNWKNALGRAHPCLVLIVRSFGGQHELAVTGDLLSLCARVHHFVLNSLYFWFNSSLQLIPWLCKFFFSFLVHYNIKLSLGFGHLWEGVKHWQCEDVQSWNSHLFSYRAELQLWDHRSRKQLIDQNAHVCFCAWVCKHLVKKKKRELSKQNTDTEK